MIKLATVLNINKDVLMMNEVGKKPFIHFFVLPKFLKLKKKTSSGIIWVRGTVLGCLVAIVSLVYKLLLKDVETPISEYAILGLIFFVFIYYSLSYYLHVRYAEIDIFKFLYISMWIALIAVLISVSTDYIFFEILEKKYSFLQVKKFKTQELHPGISTSDLNDILSTYREKMTPLYLLLKYFTICFSLAFIWCLVSYRILKVKQRKEIVNIRQIRSEILRKFKPSKSRRINMMRRSERKKARVMRILKNIESEQKEKS